MPIALADKCIGKADKTNVVGMPIELAVKCIGKADKNT